MAFSRKRPQNEPVEIVQIPTDKLLPNPSQPRTQFDSQGLRELALSIEQHGILQPLAVRQVGRGYELIAGERRLRAAKLAGLRTVPCMVLQTDDAESSLLSIIENIQRRDLDFFEVARGYQRLMHSFGMTQEQVAVRVGKTQSAVANKLRLLRFDSELISFIRAAGLTERHCRAILCLPPTMYRSTLERVAAETMTVAQTEEMVDSMMAAQKKRIRTRNIEEYFTTELGEMPWGEEKTEKTEETAETEKPAEEAEAPKEKKPAAAKSREARGKLLVKDARIFVNTILRAFDVMKASGIDASCQQHEEEEYTELLIRIPRRHGETDKKIPIAQT